MVLDLTRKFNHFTENGMNQTCFARSNLTYNGIDLAFGNLKVDIL
jgi:hypothetical protein